MRPRGGMVIGVLVGVLALAAAGCGGGDDDGGSASATTAAPETTSAPATTAAGGGGEDELQLTASGTAWDTTSLDMTAGAEVSVEVDNQDSIQHNFTFAGGPGRRGHPGQRGRHGHLHRPGRRQLRVPLQVPPVGDEGDRHRHLNTSTVFVL